MQGHDYVCRNVRFMYVRTWGLCVEEHEVYVCKGMIKYALTWGLCMQECEVYVYKNRMFMYAWMWDLCMQGHICASGTLERKSA
jgi:hypothetical protein